MTYSKTAAMKKAAACVSIHGSGTSWTICAPYHDSKPDGPYTNIHATSYVAAVRRAAKKKALITLALMGRMTHGEEIAVEEADHSGTHDVRGLIRAGLAA